MLSIGEFSKICKASTKTLRYYSRNRVHACAAMGDGGNVIYFNKKKKIVVSIASLFVKNAKDRIELIKEYIEPIF